MPRKRAQPAVVGPDWFLVDWMRYYGKSQADLGRATDKSKATINDIVNGKTNYYRELVNEMASALNIQPYELLMHPDDAMTVRRMRDDALRLAAENSLTFKTETAADAAGDRLAPRRKTG